MIFVVWALACAEPEPCPADTRPNPAGAGCLDGAGNLHGPFEHRHPTSGRLLETGAYVHGRKDGVFTTFDVEGRVETTTRWVDGLREGEARRFAGGVEVERSSFVRDRPHGRWFGWRPDGSPAWERTYEDGSATGEEAWFDAEGRPIPCPGGTTALLGAGVAACRRERLDGTVVGPGLRLVFADGVPEGWWTLGDLRIRFVEGRVEGAVGPFALVGGWPDGEVEVVAGGLVERSRFRSGRRDGFVQVRRGDAPVFDADADAMGPSGVLRWSSVVRGPTPIRHDGGPPRAVPPPEGWRTVEVGRAEVHDRRLTGVTPGLALDATEDAEGRLLSLSGPDGPVLEWDADGRRETLTDGASAVVRRFGPEGRLRSIEDGTWTLGFDAAGLARVVGPGVRWQRSGGRHDVAVGGDRVVVVDGQLVAAETAEGAAGWYASGRPSSLAAGGEGVAYSPDGIEVVTWRGEAAELPGEHCDRARLWVDAPEDLRFGCLDAQGRVDGAWWTIGAVATRADVRAGWPDGDWRAVDGTATVLVSGRTRDGVPDGVWTWPSGALPCVGSGRMEGTWRAGWAEGPFEAVGTGGRWTVGFSGFVAHGPWSGPTGLGAVAWGAGAPGCPPGAEARGDGAFVWDRFGSVLCRGPDGDEVRTGGCALPWSVGEPAEDSGVVRLVESSGTVEGFLADGVPVGRWTLTAADGTPRVRAWRTVGWPGVVVVGDGRPYVPWFDRPLASACCRATCAADASTAQAGLGERPDCVAECDPADPTGSSSYGWTPDFDGWRALLHKGDEDVGFEPSPLGCGAWAAALD